MNKLSVLLVEDDDVQAEAVERSIGKSTLETQLVWAEDGLEALEILRKQHPTKRIERPYIILLDLNMPRMNGFEFLERIRNDLLLKDSVVFVLTTSDADTDRTRAYHENIAGYMVKQQVGPMFAKLVNLLRAYGESVTLPG